MHRQCYYLVTNPGESTPMRPRGSPGICVKLGLSHVWLRPGPGWVNGKWVGRNWIGRVTTVVNKGRAYPYNSVKRGWPSPGKQALEGRA